jgi:hypothetical protein
MLACLALACLLSSGVKDGYPLLSYAPSALNFDVEWNDMV